MYGAKIAIIAIILLIGLVSIPVGAMLAERRARAAYTRDPLRRGLSGAAIARLLLIKESLGRIRVTDDAAPLRETYDAHAGKIVLAEETARLSGAFAAATAAFLVAQVVIHAEDVAATQRSQRRAFYVTIMVNLLPPLIVAACVIPGSGRALGIVAAVLLSLVFLYTALEIPTEWRARRIAIDLIRRHKIAEEKSELIALHKCIAARASARVAAPLKQCLWIRPLL